MGRIKVNMHLSLMNNEQYQIRMDGTEHGYWVSVGNSETPDEVSFFVSDRKGLAQFTKAVTEAHEKFLLEKEDA